MSLNVELLRKVRDAIADEANPVGFDMSEWGVQTGCGTTCCIAGHAVVIGAKNRWRWEDGRMVPRTGYPDDIGTLGAEVLGISESEARHLFHGYWSETFGSNITRAEAVAYLDRCIEAGEIVR